MLYVPEYENDILNWLAKHALEMLLAVTLMFMVWEGRLLLEIKDQQTRNTVQIEHINKAVNDVGDNEKTLREAVTEMNTALEVLQSRSRQRYRNE